MRVPGLSSGLRVTRFTVPEMVPSIMSAVLFLNTSTRPSSSGETSLKLSVRPPLAEKMSRPFSSDRTKGSPRMITPDPSTENRSGSFACSKRLMFTPGTRCSASATERSGSAPISSAVITSTNVSASRFRFCALSSEARKPLTMMTSSLLTVPLRSSLGPSIWPSSGGAAAGACWAWAPEAARMARLEAVLQLRMCRVISPRPAALVMKCPS